MHESNLVWNGYKFICQLEDVNGCSGCCRLSIVSLSSDFKVDGMHFEFCVNGGEVFTVEYNDCVLLLSGPMMKIVRCVISDCYFGYRRRSSLALVNAICGR